MTKTIKVRGSGTIQAPVDWIKLNLHVKTKKRIYEDALIINKEKVEKLYETLGAAHIDQQAIKTRRFHVETVYKTVNNDYQNRVFDGYHCQQELSFGFAYDLQQLQAVIDALISADTGADFDLQFTVKDESFYREKVLQAATENARKEAEILAAASQLTLGPLMTIDYSSEDLAIIAPMDFRVEARLAAIPDMEAEDITLSETVHFVWELN